MIVETYLPYRDHLGVLRGYARELRARLFRPGRSVVGVHSERAPHACVLVRKRCARERGLPVVADGDQPLHSRARGGGDHLRHLGEQALVGEMTVGVYEHQQTSLPAGTGFSGETMTTSPSAVTAQSSMPWLSMPRSLAGLRLATTTTCLPTISSGV